tara:strand:- start:1602 stop:2591 length:990 start_codon:yes stop_codon:yes gene_type:complete
LHKKLNQENNKKSININFDDISLVPQLIGVNNKNLREIEDIINVELDSNGSIINLYGRQKDCILAKKIIENSYLKLKDYKKNKIEFEEFSINFDINNVINKSSSINEDNNISEIYKINTWKKTIIPKTDGHKSYLSSLYNNDVVFCTGPAGSGKTYLAVANAINNLKNRKVEKVILSRPAVEAGEKIGFLPGDIKEKVDPYLRPIYDALNDMMPADKVEKKLLSGEIEIAPLAFMRGRTLKNSYIIIDEAQNTSQIQMKMVLTRLGEGSRMVVTGDLTQVDLPKGQKSGLSEAVKILDGIKRIDILKLDAVDIVRHPVVSKIIKAYEKL